MTEHRDENGEELAVGDRVLWLSWGLPSSVEALTAKRVRILVEDSGGCTTSVRPENLSKAEARDEEGS